MKRRLVISIIVLIAITSVILINRTYFKKNINFNKMQSIKMSKVDFPSFSVNDIDGFISKYISNKYSEKIVNYNYYSINGIYTSIIITNESNSTHESILIDNRTSKKISIYDLTTNKDDFNKIVNNYLSDKYPAFIIDGINKLKENNISYSINNESLNIYYDNVETTPKFDKEVFLRISLMALKDVLNIEINNTSEIKLDNDNLDKVVALTFDDGPCANTDKVLELLKENNSTATFFLQGYKINSFKETLIKMIDYGNEAGNHTYSHKYLTKLKQKEFEFQINKTNELYYESVNKSLYLIRPPYGSVNKKVKSLVNGPIILWNLDTKDWKSSNSVEDIISSVLNNVSDGDIILMHDIHNKTYEALKTILPELYVKGYKVVSVSELAQLKNITLVPGKTYFKIN